MQNRPVAVALVLIAVALCSCQHIPPQPLDIAAVRADLNTRLDRLADIEDYATSLSSESNQQVLDFNVDDSITLHEATLIALWYNGEARLVREEVWHALERARLAGLIDDPALSIVAGETQEDTITGIEKSLVLGGALSITIPVSGRRGATRTLRDTEFRTALLAAEETEWRATNQLRDAWFQWSATTEHITVLVSHLDWLNSVVTLTSDLAISGELDGIQAQFFAIEYSRLQASLTDLRSQAAIERLKCLSIMGLHPDADVRLMPELSDRPAASDSSTIPDTHPTLERLQTEYQVAEDALRLEIRKQYPDITITPGITDEESETEIRLGLGIPIPVWNANRLGIQEAIGHRHDAKIRVENGILRLTTELAIARQRLESSQQQWDHLAGETAGLIRKQVDQVQRLLDAGELDFLLLSGVLNQSLSLKRELIDVQLRRQLAHAAVRAATVPYQYTNVFEWENTREKTEH